ncbi:lactonase family protein [Pantoea anthophila]|uniref:lactonase family protein n=1 Tax=Pantoea anthophila TaxID=470931 RepID=UPI003017CDB8
MNRFKTALALLPLLCSPSVWATTFVYVSNAESGTVSRYALNEATGSLHWRGETPSGGKIMPLAASPDGQHLYGALRSPPYAIVSWRVTRPHGDLQRMAVTPVAASFPWITTDRRGHFLLAASYDSDIVTSNRIYSQGRVTEQVTGEVKTGPHAHSVITDVSNHALYVGNLGTDRVLQYAFSDDGVITPLGKGFVQGEKNSGARHSVISPDNRFVYNLAEMSGTVTQFRRAADGSLTALKRWPNAVAKRYNLQHGEQRPAGYSDPTPRIWAADIQITPDGHFIYVTERTSSTVSGYRVDKASGELTLIGSWPVEKQPRSIAIDAQGKWLIVSGEKSAVISSYAIDPASGELKRVSEAPAGKGANWVTLIAQ